jgi:L-asparaginase / beta-aspartyl-peptidase
MPIPTIIAHGGAGAIADDTWRDYKEGAHEAARIGQTALDSGASALDAAIEAVLYMEDHPCFNAGRGSGLNRDGVVECDAFVMTDKRQSGAVSGLSTLRHPVLLARLVLEHTAHQYISGHGALELAVAHGLALCAPEELIVEKRLRRWQELTASGVSFTEQLGPEDLDNPKLQKEGDAMRAEPCLRPVVGATHGSPAVNQTCTGDLSVAPTESTGRMPVPPPDEPSDTVGACCIDQQGRIAVASSTGGIMLKHPGRVGDTPIVGAGNYCGPAGVTACTGHGEAVMRVCLAKYAYDLLEAGCCAAEAAQRSVAHLVDTVDGKAGIIVLDRHGNRAWATSTMRIAVGVPEKLVDANVGVL